MRENAQRERTLRSASSTPGRSRRRGSANPSWQLLSDSPLRAALIRTVTVSFEASGKGAREIDTHRRGAQLCHAGAGASEEQVMRVLGKCRTTLRSMSAKPQRSAPHRS